LEINTVVGKKTKGQAVLLILTERKTRKEIILWLSDKSSQAVQETLIELANEACPHFPKAFKIFTTDNVSKFSELQALATITGTDIYYAHP